MTTATLPDALSATKPDPETAALAADRDAPIWLVVLRMTGCDFPLMYFHTRERAIQSAKAIGARDNCDGLEDILTKLDDVWEGGMYDTFCCLAVVPMRSGPGVTIPESVEVVVDLDFMNEEPDGLDE